MVVKKRKVTVYHAAADRGCVGTLLGGASLIPDSVSKTLHLSQNSSKLQDHAF